MKKLALILLLAFAARAELSQDVRVAVSGGGLEDGGLTQFVSVASNSSVVLGPVEVDIALASPLSTTTLAVTLLAMTSTCTALEPRHVRCRIPELHPGSTVPFRARVTPAEGRLRLTAYAEWAQDGKQLTSIPAATSHVLRRELLVTNTRDAGEGSLRAAIETANTAGAGQPLPLRIRFAIDEPAVEGVHTIRPHTPLPPIVASDIHIRAPFGTLATRVELDGALVSGGSGLELLGEGFFEIEGLVIGGFPWDGITVRRRGAPALEPSRIAFCVIGQHHDQTPNPNRSRGVTLDAPASNLLISSTLMSANGRSGLFIAGATDVTVTGSILNHNGASGVYVGPGSRNVRLETNSFTNNAHFGVAIARGARRVHLVNLFAAGNRNLPIDHNLDGFSGYTFNGHHTPAPHIEAIAYDAATKMTTVTGTFDAPDPSLDWRITLYNATRLGEFGERPETHVRGNRFTFTLPGELRGPTSVLADSADLSDWSTSEFSNVVTP